MICPRGNGECHCNEFMQTWKCDPLAPPKPTLAEFERLVDVFGEAVQSLCHFDECGTGYGRPELEVERDAARAALLAAIRQYGEV